MRNLEVFLDTGYLLAPERPASRRGAYPLARDAAAPTALGDDQLYVFDEVVTFLNRRGHHRKAVDVGRRLATSPSVELVHVDERLFGRGFDLLERRPDKRYSLTDCVSFVFMGERDIATAFAFDEQERVGPAKERRNRPGSDALSPSLRAGQRRFS